MDCSLPGSCSPSDLGWIPGLGRSPGEGKDYPFQYSGLENSINDSPWGRKESDTTKWLSLSLWTARSIQPILKEINLEYSLEGLMLKREALILWPPDVKNQLIGKDLDSGEDWGQEEKEATEDEMVGWHHRFNGHEFLSQTPGDGEGQGSLVCCSPWGCRVRHDWLTEQKHIYKGEPLLSCSPLYLHCYVVLGPGHRGGPLIFCWLAIWLLFDQTPIRIIIKKKKLGDTVE